MQCSNGRVRAVVRSSRVPVGLSQFTMTSAILGGFSTNTNVRSVVYANVLDEAQQRLLDEARRLARASCLPLEVVDLGRSSLLRRAVSRLRGDSAPSQEGLQLEVRNLADIEAAFNSSIR